MFGQQDHYRKMIFSVRHIYHYCRKNQKKQGGAIMAKIIVSVLLIASTIALPVSVIYAFVHERRQKKAAN